MTPETVSISRETAELALKKFTPRKFDLVEAYGEEATRRAVHAGLGAGEWKALMPKEYRDLVAAITDLKRALAGEEGT